MRFRRCTSQLITPHLRIPSTASMSINTLFLAVTIFFYIIQLLFLVTILCPALFEAVLPSSRHVRVGLFHLCYLQPPYQLHYACRSFPDASQGDCYANKNGCIAWEGARVVWLLSSVVGIAGVVESFGAVVGRSRRRGRSWRIIPGFMLAQAILVSAALACFHVIQHHTTMLKDVALKKGYSFWEGIFVSVIDVLGAAALFVLHAWSNVGDNRTLEGEYHAIPEDVMDAPRD